MLAKSQRWWRLCEAVLFTLCRCFYAMASIQILWLVTQWRKWIAKRAVAIKYFWRPFDKSRGHSQNFYLGTLTTSNQFRNTHWFVKFSRFGAKDINSGAIKIASACGDESLIRSLLARRSHVDLEYKLNDNDLLADSNLGQTLPSFCNTYCNLFPTHATVIDWNFTTCKLEIIK